MCYFCGQAFEGRVYRGTTCPNCGKELKICLNCKFYSPGAHWDCKETIPEPVREKDKANFCDYFVYVNRQGSTKHEEQRKQARSEFNNLFGDG